MKMRFASIAVLCLISVVACGETETDREDDVALVESETVITDTDAAITDPVLATGTEEVVEPLETTTAATPAPSAVGKTPATSTPATKPAAVAKPATPSEPVRSEPAPAPEPQTTKPAPAAEPAPAEAAPATSSKRPKTHTVDQGGVMHAPGSDNPTKRCAACHGKDLKGGKAGVSCFDCHDQKWE